MVRTKALNPAFSALFTRFLVTWKNIDVLINNDELGFYAISSIKYEIVKYIMFYLSIVIDIQLKPFQAFWGSFSNFFN